MNEPSEKPTLFYADPVDADGKKVATATFRVTHSPWPMDVVKVPASEIVLDPETTIRADLTGGEDR